MFQPRPLFLSSAIAAVIFGSAGTPLQGSVVEADAFSTIQTNFDGNILANDLIENGSSVLSSVSTTGSVSTYTGEVPPNNNFDHLTDGGASTKIVSGAGTNDISRDTYFDGVAFSTNPSITYNFSGALGIQITSINSILGWADTKTFSNQRYTISLELVGAPGVFTTLGAVNYAPFSDNGGADPNSSQVTLTDTTGVIATGVSAVRFAFQDNGGSGQVFREIDVVGSVVPEPGAALSLLGGAATLLAWRRRRS